MKKLIIYITVIAICSCNDNTKSIESPTYEVLTVLYDTLAQKREVYPYFKDGINEKDSLRNVQKLLEIRRTQKNEQQIVAINPYLSLPVLEHLNSSKIKDEFKELVSELALLEEKKPLDINKIKTKRKDSIIVFHDSLLDPMVSDYLKFNKLISFSRVVFNDEFTKAVLVASAGTSRRAGFSGMYFLRKINEEWVIVDYLGISIS